MKAANKPPHVAEQAANGRTCAICGKPVVPKYQPFCSKRCADIDLHRWLGGKYAIPADPSSDEEDSMPGDDGHH